MAVDSMFSAASVSDGCVSGALPVALTTASRIAAKASSEDCCRPSSPASTAALSRPRRDPFLSFLRRAMRYCGRSWLNNMRADSQAMVYRRVDKGLATRHLKPQVLPPRNLIRWWRRALLRKTRQYCKAHTEPFENWKNNSQ
jgi:hypothetical protein